MRKIELKERQDLSYEIFVEFDRVCRAHGITYSMEGGTLLGAVKYGDFVPWDDDIDVVMKREEYQRFLKIAPTALGEKFFLESYHNVEEFPLNYAKLCLNGTTTCDYVYTHLKRMHHGLFIDIFPIDRVKPEKLRRQTRRVGVLTGARKTKLRVKLGGSRLKRAVYRLVSLLPMRTLCRMLDRACTRYNKKETGYAYEVCNSNRKFAPLPAKTYDELTELSFRDGHFYAAKDYDGFLRSRFGENYMAELPPEEARRPSHNSNIFFTDEE